MTEYCGWFYTQGVHMDTFGNKYWKKLCLTNDDISCDEYTVNEIEFVHEVNFVIVSQHSTCLPVVYNWDKSGHKHVRYIVKALFVNRIFTTAYPVLVDSVLLWLQHQVQGRNQRIQARHMTLVDTVLGTFGKHLNVIVSQCLEVNINALMYQSVQSPFCPRQMVSIQQEPTLQ